MRPLPLLLLLLACAPDPSAPAKEAAQKEASAPAPGSSSGPAPRAPEAARLTLELSTTSGALRLPEIEAFQKGALAAVPGLREAEVKEIFEGVATIALRYEGDAKALAAALDGREIGGRECKVREVGSEGVAVVLR